MKKSDRLIIRGALFAVFVMITVNVVLYIRLQQGKIWDVQDLQNGQSIVFRTRPVQSIIVDGAVWINIIPCDSDLISFPKDVSYGREGSSVLPVYHLDGDSLFIKGSNTKALHRPDGDWNYVQYICQVNVYSSAVRYIRVVNGQAVVKGGRDRIHGQSFRVEGNNSTIWLGQVHRRRGGSSEMPDSTFFHDCLFDLTNSVIVMNKASYIDSVNGSLTNGSSIYDKEAVIGPSRLMISDDSKVSITGSNLLHTAIFKH